MMMMMMMMMIMIFFHHHHQQQQQHQPATTSFRIIARSLIRGERAETQQRIVFFVMSWLWILL